MFDFIRRHQRLVLIFLTVLIVPSFVVFGVHGLQDYAADASTIAKVGDQTVTRQEYDSVLRAQTERMQQMFGGAVDASQINTPEMRSAVLDNLIQQKLLTQETLKKNLSVPDAQVREALLAIPAIAQLRRPDGSFDQAKYEQLLSAQNLTPQRLEAQIRFELASNQLPASVQASAMLPKAVLDRFAQLRAQQRDVAVLNFQASDFAGKVVPTPQQMQAYYDAHKAAFQTPESAEIQYVVLDPKAMPASAQTPASDDVLRKLYNDNLKQYTTQEERRASHILIASPADASPADHAKAKAKAEALLAQIKQHPNDFAKLASENSEDPGSKANGGDLGFFARDAMVKPFADATFALKTNGDVSDVVKSDFGYHIIKLTGIKPAQTKSFDEVKGQLADQYRQQESAKAYAKLADQFTNAVYEQPDSLQPVADQLNLKVLSAKVTRTPDPSQAQSPLGNEKLLKAVFGDESLKNKRNTEAVDVGQGVLVSAHVVNYHPAATPPLAQIEAQVKEKAVADLADQEAKKAGEAKLDALKKGGDAAFGAVQTVSRDNPGKLPATALTAIFAADTAKLPAYVGVALGEGRGYAVYRISKVTQPAEQDAQRLAAEAQQLNQLAAQAEWNAWLGDLRARSKVKVIHDVTKAGS
ncbi:SurA N-terminal domain-containing protein [Pandoraea communis]|uniref:SurA N-terminal domain-containing protein n=1 Tax=Pandoraea communis TaxID=2508297 RepID=UPI0025A60E69|nr:SurA N-terminal domain-containing protein [Pandoraea communis]MDM8357288.1 SurA N-terminal domain-containing protein [Pandoraea communis]